MAKSATSTPLMEAGDVATSPAGMIVNEPGRERPRTLIHPYGRGSSRTCKSVPFDEVTHNARAGMQRSRIDAFSAESSGGATRNACEKSSGEALRARITKHRVWS